MKVSIWRDSRDFSSLHVGQPNEKSYRGKSLQRLFTINDDDFISLLDDENERSSVRNLGQNDVLEVEFMVSAPLPF